MHIFNKLDVWFWNKWEGTFFEWLEDVVEGDEGEGGERGHKPSRDVIFAYKTWLPENKSFWDPDDFV